MYTLYISIIYWVWARSETFKHGHEARHSKYSNEKTTKCKIAMLYRTVEKSRSAPPGCRPILSIYTLVPTRCK